MSEADIQPRDVREYMSGRRMCSVENLSIALETSIYKIWSAVKELEKDSLVRITQKRCGSSCAGCGSDCSPEEDSLIAASIVISLERKECDDECA